MWRANPNCRRWRSALPAAEKRAQIALRVNPDVPAEHPPLHFHRTAPAQVRNSHPQGAKALCPGVRDKVSQVAGVSVHIGSQITDVAAVRCWPWSAWPNWCSLLQKMVIASTTSTPAAAWASTTSEPSTQDFAAGPPNMRQPLLRPLRGLKVHLLLEPGRSIVGPAGALLTRVLYRKTNDAKQFLVVDAAMNDLIRPSLYDAYHEILAGATGRRTARGRNRGCGRAHLRERRFFCPRPRAAGGQEGDLLAILDAGAYGMSLASNYNTRPRPAEVLVDGSQ